MTNPMTADGAPQSAILFLHAQTSLHPGSGTALGVVDLPVQRERHTQWPLIPGSALKGILRDACREKAKWQFQDDGDDKPEKERRTRRQKANEKDGMLVAAFGPGKISGEASTHAGAISVCDARILAFPVRSLKGVFAWVTCPAVLERLARDLSLTHCPAPPAPPKFDPQQREQAACVKDSPLLLNDATGEKLVLE